MELTFESICKAEAYQKDIADFRSKNCEVVGISTNPMDKIKEFKAKYGLGFPMLSDRECGVVESYGAAIKLPFVGTFANRLGRKSKKKNTEASFSWWDFR
jgi:peroxiredoxin